MSCTYKLVQVIIISLRLLLCLVCSGTSYLCLSVVNNNENTNGDTYFGQHVMHGTMKL